MWCLNFFSDNSHGQLFGKSTEEVVHKTQMDIGNLNMYSKCSFFLHTNYNCLLCCKKEVTISALYLMERQCFLHRQTFYYYEALLCPEIVFGHTRKAFEHHMGSCCKILTLGCNRQLILLILETLVGRGLDSNFQFH